MHGSYRLARLRCWDLRDDAGDLGCAVQASVRNLCGRDRFGTKVVSSSSAATNYQQHITLVITASFTFLSSLLLLLDRVDVGCPGPGTSSHSLDGSHGEKGGDEKEDGSHGGDEKDDEETNDGE